MLFVVDKPALQRIMAIVRDDRSKKSQGLAGPFLRLEVCDDFLKLDGLEVTAKIPATVYEPGVLFLKATMFRRILRSITDQKFLTLQVVADGLLMDYSRMPLEPNDMLLYVDPDRAPQRHPGLSDPDTDPDPDLGSNERQLTLWNLSEEERR